MLRFYFFYFHSHCPQPPDAIPAIINPLQSGLKFTIITVIIATALNAIPHTMNTSAPIAMITMAIALNVIKPQGK